jgi:hypothetical protein
MDLEIAFILLQILGIAEQLHTLIHVQQLAQEKMFILILVQQEHAEPIPLQLYKIVLLIHLAPEELAAAVMHALQEVMNVKILVQKVKSSTDAMAQEIAIDSGNGLI